MRPLQCIYNLTLLVVNKGHELFVVDVLAVKRVFFVQLQAGFKSSIYYFSHELGVGDEVFVVEGDLVEEIGCSYLFAEVGENVNHVVHQLLLAVEVVEAEEGEVLVHGEENLPVDVVDGFVLDDSDVLGQGVVYPFSDVHVLEQPVVLLLLREVVEDVMLVEHPLLNRHQSLYIFQVYAFFESS